MADMGNQSEKIWLLKREDDNGNQFIMAAFNSADEANQMMEYYQRKKHKQMYWVEKEKRD